MATTVTKMQHIVKVAEDEYLLLHPETDADLVHLAAEGITADNVEGALLELKQLISDITGGGVVTGVKGEAEESYRQGNVSISKANVGLGNVDNTADADKPVSTAQQTALNAKEDKVNLKALAYKDALAKGDVGLGNVTNDAQVKRSEMGTPSGVATLDDTGKVPAAQLPSYVDDVIEGTYVNTTTFNDAEGSPVTPESGKIYVDTTTNKEYRWGGSQFVPIADSLALGETASTAYAGNKGKQNADNIAALQTRAGEIESKNTQQDTAISAAQSAADAAQEAAEDAQTAAETADGKAVAAQNKADANEANINKIVDGTTKVAKAGAADSATAAGKLSTAREISLTGDATGAANFDGSAPTAIAVTLKNSGVTAGTYSAVQVDAKGRVTKGGQIYVLGEEGEDTPPDDLAIGAFFIRRL